MSIQVKNKLNKVFNNGEKISSLTTDDYTKIIPTVDYFRNQSSTFSKRVYSNKKTSKLLRKRFK